MVLFNYATRELTAKVVYYGPGLCGKTTNLEFIHKTLPEKMRGKMLSLATQTDRTLFFDFLPLDLGSVKGMKTRVQLYTVPGQVFYDATRKLVLKGADGIVFVADSQKEMMQSNLDSWENLRQNLLENNLDINAIPLVIQYNKRDLPNVLPVKELNRRLNLLKVPYFEAIALTGMGVQETFKGIAKIVMSNLSKKYGRPEEVAAGTKAQQAASDKGAVPVTVKAAETFDLSALDEEIQELPQVEELEMSEESPLNLEPVEIGQKDEDFSLEEAPEIPVPEKPAVPDRPQEVLEMPVGYPTSPRSNPAMIPSSPVPESVRSVGDSAETELIPDETVHLSRASATAGATAQEIPIEISVRREGQDIKLNISIHLRIRVDND
jgi:signal recognition particle receptor subunit beta